MFPARTAIHLRTGEADVSDLVDDWLQQYEIHGPIFANAFDTCVYLLQESDKVPDLAFVGVDWLSPDEGDIVHYLRETWPALGIVVYAGGTDTFGCELKGLTQFCPSQVALQQLLEHSPEQLLQVLREHNPSDGKHRAPIYPDKWNTNSAHAAPEVPAKTVAKSDQVETGGLKGVAPHKGPPHTILTDEELSALLNDSDD